MKNFKEKLFYPLSILCVAAIGSVAFIYQTTVPRNQVEKDAKVIKLYLEKMKKFAPLPPKLTNSMRTGFRWFYKEGRNAAFYNDSFKVSLSDILVKLAGVNVVDDLHDIEGEENTGISFRYILRNTGTHMSFTYALAVSDPNGKIINRNQIYWVGSDNTLHMYGSQQEFKDDSIRYINQVKINQLGSPDSVKINLIKDTFGRLTHPRNCFFSYSTIFHFLDHNLLYVKDDANPANIEPMAYLEIFNGTIQVDLSQKRDMYKSMVQTPILVLYSRNGRLLDSDFILNQYFKNKALDVGRLCPTDCN